MNDQLMTPEEVAGYTHVSVVNLAQLRYQGKGPQYLKPTPRTVLYRRADIDAWLDASVRHGTAEAA